MSQLKFGTSGIRGLVVDFTLEECREFVAAFVESIKERNWDTVLIAGDLRESTAEIVDKVTRSFQGLGYRVLNGGRVPTPALALGCAELGLPGVMVTGSHIPADRNGLKFYFPEGEILKSDEESILANYLRLKHAGVDPCDSTGIADSVDLASIFKNRYLQWMEEGVLSGLRVGFYAHSSVARDIYPTVLRLLGAEVEEFGWSSVFVPVDTEAVESVDYLYRILMEKNLDLVISTDGDADRPLLMVEDGRVIPGELLGLIASRHLGMDAVVFPVSCSSALVDSGWIDECHITRIGSPFVLGKMLDCLREDPFKKISGFEANGGFLLGAAVDRLKPLMTRDSFLPVICFLAELKRSGGRRASELLAPFASICNISGLIKNYPLDRAARTLEAFRTVLDAPAPFKELGGLGECVSRNELDGVRARFDSGITVHLRPSGNAPEFRLYIEAKTRPEADRVLTFFENWVRSL